MARRLLILAIVQCWAAAVSSTAAVALEPIVAGREGLYACDNIVQMKTFMVELFFGGKSDDLKCSSIPAGTRILGDNVRRVNGFISGDGVANSFRNGVAFAFFGIAEPQQSPAAAAPPAAAPPAPPPVYVPPPPRVFKVISPSDVRATPDKWQGRDIEFRNVNVYWVDDDDIRITTSDSLTVFVKRVRGGGQLKDKCETVKDAVSSKCRATVRFSYQAYDVDQPSGLAKRTVLVTNDAELIVGRGK
jgi:hypothetical protein